MAAINVDVHKVVVVFEGTEFGFTSLAASIGFIEQQYAGVKDYNKVLNVIATAMSDDKADNVQIYDIEMYSDLFIDDEDDEDEDA